jgi:succinate-acetate transporter protein
MEAIFNRCEAALWGLVAIALFVRAFRDRRALRGTWVFLAIAFAAFSVSDVIELRSSAWWRPWWLLVLKVACVAGMFFGFRRSFRLRRKSLTEERDPAGNEENHLR